MLVERQPLSSLRFAKSSEIPRCKNSMPPGCVLRKSPRLRETEFSGPAAFYVGSSCDVAIGCPARLICINANTLMSLSLIFNQFVGWLVGEIEKNETTLSIINGDFCSWKRLCARGIAVERCPAIFWRTAFWRSSSHSGLLRGS
jgi:hypothetical protein